MKQSDSQPRLPSSLNNPTSVKTNNQFGITSIAIIVILFVVGLGTYFLFLKKIIPQTQQTAPSSTPISSPAEILQPVRANQNSNSSSETENERQLHSSLEGNYFFYVVNPPAEFDTTCDYYVRDKNMNKIDISGLIGTKTLPCSNVGYFYQGDAFLNWATGDKLVIDYPSGDIKIVDVKNLKVSEYKYDKNTYKPFQSNKTLKYWLFTDITTPNTKRRFVLLDDQANIIKDLTFDIEYSDPIYNQYFFSEVFYDPINDGYLFVISERKPAEGTDYNQANYPNYISASIQFDFLSLNPPALRNILTTDFYKRFSGGHGCEPGDSIQSTKAGEIIFNGRCANDSLDKKYISPDGNVHIKL